MTESVMRSGRFGIRGQKFSVNKGERWYRSEAEAIEAGCRGRQVTLGASMHCGTTLHLWLTIRTFKLF